MSVWILTDNFCDGSEVIGVFSTQKKMREAAKEYLDIQEGYRKQNLKKVSKNVKKHFYKQKVNHRIDQLLLWESWSVGYSTICGQKLEMDTLKQNV